MTKPKTSRQALLSDTPTVPRPGTRLHTPRRSRHVPASDWAKRYHRPIPAEWQAIAKAKGFHVRSRVRDRYHVVLECMICGGLTAQKAFTLRTVQPRCGACAEAALIEEARAAGLTFLSRDDEDRHFAYYRASCGHVLKRQSSFIQRVAAGVVDVRCEHCLVHREEVEAKGQGWTRLERDPQDDNYRIYQHSCGHRQRVVPVNMAWGQVQCAGCSSAWNAHPSFIYLMRIEVGSLRVLKLGFSKHPVKRYSHQLGLPPGARVELVRTLPVETGHEACVLEKAAHAKLCQQHPEMVIAPEVYAGVLNVKTEIYAPAAFDRIMALMDEIEAATTTPRT